MSLRIAPGDTADNAVARLREHCERHVPWGADLTFTVIDTGEATQIDATGPTYDDARAAFTEAWDGTAPIDVGIGGSIPFIAEFVEAYPQASVLVTGVGVDRPAGLGGGSCSAAPQTPLPTSSRGPSLARCFDP